MDAHRPAYEAAKKDFEQFIEALIAKLCVKDSSVAGITARSCIFRINKDTRFSKDKSPYKTNMGAFISKGGKKGIHAGYYFHLEPGNSFAGGGMYMPMPAELAKVRQEIDYHFDDFQKLLQRPDFRKTYGGLDLSKEYQLAKMPKGYQADNPAAEYLRLKSFISFRSFTDAEITDKNLLRKTEAAFAALQPLVEFLNIAVDE